MAVVQKTRSPFADLLREALEETGVGMRQLARLLTRTEVDTRASESRRRLLQRYAAGEVSPTDPARDEIADALGLPRERFAIDREHEQERRRVMNALLPLADVLLELATQTRQRDQKDQAA